MNNAYLPAGFPPVRPTLDDRAFWAHCNARRLCFQRCGDCGRFRHPPTPLCPHCQSQRLDWIEAPASGRIFSYTVIHHPGHPAAAAAVPYNVVLVEFAECGGVRLISNVVDAAPHELAAGHEVALTWEPGPGDQLLPRFRLHRDRGPA